MSDEPLLAADASQDLDGVARGSASGAPEGDGETTEGGSPSALSVIPEGSESDFSAHVQQVMLAAWQEVSTSEDLTSELEELETDESQQLIYAAVEQAAAGMGRRPHEWPQHLETIQQRQVIHEQCHYVLRGAVLDDYATLEEEDDAGKHVELYLDP